MAELTIRNSDDELKVQLRIRSALGTRIHQRVMALTGGVDLSLPIRSLPRVAPTLQDWHYNDDRFIPCPHEAQADEYHP
jgi:hypothetical protein